MWGPLKPLPMRGKKTTLLSNILKPLEVESGNAILENIEKRIESENGSKTKKSDP
jgi:hypothetical protein